MEICNSKSQHEGEISDGIATERLEGIALFFCLS